MKVLGWAFVLIFAGTYSSACIAWSGYVHELICEMAVQQLSKKDRRKVIKLGIGQNAVEEYRGFPKACVWADEVRSTTHLETDQYHYMNVPKQHEVIDFSRDCAAFDCVGQAVVRYALYLNNLEAKEEHRAESLRFLGHFVADLHQPLHVGFGEDLGGNILFVARTRGDRADQRLHAIWDGAIANRAGLRAQGDDVSESMPEMAKSLVQDISLEEVHAWRNLSVESWARESYKHARECAYRINCDNNKRFLRNGDYLSDAYWVRAEPVVRKRIKMASVRLAYLIELALAADLEPALLEGD